MNFNYIRNHQTLIFDKIAWIGVEFLTNIFNQKPIAVLLGNLIVTIIIGTLLYLIEEKVLNNGR